MPKETKQSSNDDFRQALEKLRQQQQQVLQNLLNGSAHHNIGNLAGYRTNLEHMNRDLSKLNRKPKVSKEERIRQIEHELDIIRGIQPTPKGYIINPSKVKSLMAELRDLKK